MGKGFLNEGVFSRRYLQGRLQVLARADASTCGNGWKYVRERLHVLASKMSQTVAEIVSPILDKRKGRKDSLHTGHYSPQEISAEPVYDQNARKSQSQRERKKQGIEPTETQSPLYNVKSLFKKLHSSNIHAHALFSCKTYASRISRFRFRAPSRPITP